jgi:GAF domain-containing protein/PucR-like helix-turn-helix protein
VSGPADTSADEHRRRRERELASLYATARSLTALGEVDTVLSAIVRHAHELTGADLTYLSVFEGDSLQLRAVEGAVSARFRTARVGSSTGIGGRVVRTSAPAWVSNYLTDRQIEHSPAFDELVADEGLVALLGVPLLAGGRVTGVLYAADRVERPWTPDEVALLSALADHASIALENARLYEQSRSALADLQQAYATIERSGQVHEALTRIVLTGGGEAEVASLLTEALGGRVTMVDRHDEVSTSRTQESGTDAAEPAAWRDALRESRASGRSAVATGADGPHHTVAAINTGDSYLGAVVWSHRDEPTELDRRTLERASQIVGLLALKQDAMAQAEERLRGEVLTELMRSSLPLGAGLVARGRAMRLDLDGFDAVVVVHAAGGPSRDVSRRLTAAARDWAGLAGEHLGQPAIVLRSSDLPLTARAVHRSLRAGLGRPLLVCGAALDGHPAGFGRAFDLAARCARVLAAAGTTDLATTTTENGFFGVLFDPERGEELTAFLQANLGRLERYDHQNGTALIVTLTSYYANGGNIARTARALHVHTNTLLKRLERVAAVLGEDWNGPDRGLGLQLALRLRGLSSAADG